MKVLKVLAGMAVVGLLALNIHYVSGLHYKVNKLEQNNLQQELILQRLEKIDSNILKLNEVHPSLKKTGKKWGANVCKKGTFLGFLLAMPVDTSIKTELKNALSAYSGPAARINSLKRHYNRSSEHFHGGAVDLAWDEEVIEYLLSEEGRKWLCDHGLCFYIEGRPGSRKVAKYHQRQEARKFVFFNKEATGDHVHLNLNS